MARSGNMAANWHGGAEQAVNNYPPKIKTTPRDALVAAETMVREALSVSAKIRELLCGTSCEADGEADKGPSDGFFGEVHSTADSIVSMAREIRDNLLAVQSRM